MCDADWEFGSDIVRTLEAAPQGQDHGRCINLIAIPYIDEAFGIHRSPIEDLDGARSDWFGSVRFAPIALASCRRESGVGDLDAYSSS